MLRRSLKPLPTQRVQYPFITEFSLSSLINYSLIKGYRAPWYILEHPVHPSSSAAMWEFPKIGDPNIVL